MNAIESFANTSEIKSSTEGFVGHPTGLPIATAVAVTSVAVALFAAGVASDIVESAYADSPDVDGVGSAGQSADELLSVREGAFAA